MFTRFAILPLVLAFSFSTCKKHQNLAANPQPQKGTPAATAVSPSPSASAADSSAPAPKPAKPVVGQTAQTIVFGYHRFVDKVRHPDTEITPADFEAQMAELKNHGITV